MSAFGMELHHRLCFPYRKQFIPAIVVALVLLSFLQFAVLIRYVSPQGFGQIEFKLQDIIKQVEDSNIFLRPVTPSIRNMKHGTRKLYSAGVRLEITHQVWAAAFGKWFKTTECDGKFTGYGREAALVHDVIINKTCATGRKGGEDFRTLMRQAEEDEYYTFKPGFMRMPCDKVPTYGFRRNNHINKWMASMRSQKSTANKTSAALPVIRDEFYIAVTRYEYVNIYHTMTDYYGAFLVMTLCNETQENTNILIIDAHPQGSLDDTWRALFNSFTRLSQLPPVTKFRKLAFSILGYNTPIFSNIDNIPSRLPLVEEFRNYFLASFGTAARNDSVKCDALKVRFIWRRNYVAHPRNPTGIVHRKIQNEEELVEAVKMTYPGFSVTGMQTDRFDMRDQVHFISGADILVGMHGAALTLALLMPRGRAMVELMPSYINPANKKHFIAIARWKDLIYKRWYNQDPHLEKANFTTEVPPKVVLNRIEEIRTVWCGKPLGKAGLTNNPAIKIT